MPNKVLLLHYRAPTNLYSHVWHRMGIVYHTYYSPLPLERGQGGEAPLERGQGGEAVKGEATWRGCEAPLSHKVTIFRP